MNWTSSNASQTSVADIVNSAIATVLMANSQNCNKNGTVIADMTFGDINLGDKCGLKNIINSASLKMNMKCAQDTNNASDLQNKIADEIKQKLESESTAEGGGLGLSLSGTNSSVDNTMISSAVSNIVNTIDVSNLATCVETAISKASLQGKNINCNSPAFTSIENYATAELISDCMQNNSSTTKLINDLQTKIDEEGKATSTASSSSWLVYLLIGIVLTICVGIGIWYYNS